MARPLSRRLGLARLCQPRSKSLDHDGVGDVAGSHRGKRFQRQVQYPVVNSTVPPPLGIPPFHPLPRCRHNLLYPIERGKPTYMSLSPHLLSH